MLGPCVRTGTWCENSLFGPGMDVVLAQFPPHGPVQTYQVCPVSEGLSEAGERSVEREEEVEARRRGLIAS